MPTAYLGEDEMGAPTFDKVLPPIVFLVSVLTVFLFLIIAMNPTIESNLQNNNPAPGSITQPDYETMIFTNTTMSWFSPNPAHVTIANRLDSWPITFDSKRVHYTSSLESSHPITAWIIGKQIGDLGSMDRHSIVFKQSGGWLGTQNYFCTVNSNDWVITTAISNGTIITSFACEIVLRHNYFVVVTPGPGNNDAYTSFLMYDYNMSVGMKTGNISTDPWAIASQLFTFNLPGVPAFLTALILAPIFVTIGVVAYIVVRSAFPG